ncbi:MAG TPA: universal stress protein [Pseudonocardia sp.]|nr:universal stress protein [Pseudonocardia sp.]
MSGASRPGRCVVVGVDGSGPALRAVRWAAPEALRRRVPLRIVLAADLPHEAQREERLGALRERLDDAAGEAARVAPGVEVETQLVIGRPGAVLHSESGRARLTVVGERGLGGFTGLLLGSVPVTLAGHTGCPLVVVRGVTDGPAAPVVVGVDGSPLSEAAIGFAYEQAAAYGVGLVAVHTWSDVLVDPMPEPLLDRDAVEADEHRLLAERLAGWAEKYPDVTVRRVVTRHRPARALIEQSAGSRLVVVGSRGRGGLRGLVLGSVGHALLHHAACPVAIVPPETGRGREVG